jgi:hypothetical protein
VEYCGVAWEHAGIAFDETHTDDPGERADAPTDPVQTPKAFRDRTLWLAAPTMTGRDGPTQNE